MYRTFGKRLFDIIIAFAGLIVLSPLLFFLMVLLAISNRGNPFFCQLRPGFKERIFLMVKFKTMRDTVDQHHNLLPDHERISPIGNLIRKTSLDELPQLWNVLIGDMSIIGPRPLLVEYLPLYDPNHRKRHDLRPGITGWAQIHGRNAISWEAKFDHDLWYIENVSLVLDFRIMYLTVFRVLAMKNINGNLAGTEKFKG